MEGNSSVALGLSADLSEGRLADLTRSLARDLSSIGIGRAYAPTFQSQPGERGIAAAIGTILIDALHGSGKTVAECTNKFLEVLKVYMMREKTLAVDVALPDGTKFTLNSKNIGSAPIERLVKTLIERG